VRGASATSAESRAASAAPRVTRASGTWSSARLYCSARRGAPGCS
jgi:hypothetical protein